MPTRRGFMATLTGTIVALVTRPFARTAAQEAAPPAKEAASTGADSADAYAGASQKVAIPLDDAKDLREVGGSVTLKVGDRQILLVRDSEATVRAFSPACTHRQVKVKYDHKNQRLNCPAHGSRFDLEGEVLRGPAKDPLETYHAELSGDRVILAFEEAKVPQTEEGATKPESESRKEESSGDTE